MSSLLRNLIYNEKSRAECGSEDESLLPAVHHYTPGDFFFKDANLPAKNYFDESLQVDKTDADNGKGPVDLSKFNGVTQKHVLNFEVGLKWMPPDDPTEMCFVSEVSKELRKENIEAEHFYKKVSFSHANPDEVRTGHLFHDFKVNFFMDPETKLFVKGQKTHKSASKTQLQLLRDLVKGLRAAQDKEGLIKALLSLYKVHHSFDPDCYAASVWILHRCYEEAKSDKERELLDMEASTFWDPIIPEIVNRGGDRFKRSDAFDTISALLDCMNFFGCHGNFKKAMDVAAEHMRLDVYAASPIAMTTEALCHVFQLLTIFKRSLLFATKDGDLTSIQNKEQRLELESDTIDMFLRNPFVLETFLENTTPFSEAYWMCKQIRMKLTSAAVMNPENSQLRALIAAFFVGSDHKNKRVIEVAGKMLQAHAEKYPTCISGQQYLIMFNKRYFPEKGLLQNIEPAIRWFSQDPSNSEVVSLLLQTFLSGNLSVMTLVLVTITHISAVAHLRNLKSDLTAWGQLCWLLGALKCRGVLQDLGVHSLLDDDDICAAAKEACAHWRQTHFYEGKLRGLRLSLEALPDFNMLRHYNFKIPDAFAIREETNPDEAQRKSWVSESLFKEEIQGSFIGVNHFPSFPNPEASKKPNPLESMLCSYLLKGSDETQTFKGKMYEHTSGDSSEFIDFNTTEDDEWFDENEDDDQSHTATKAAQQEEGCTKIRNFDWSRTADYQTQAFEITNLERFGCKGVAGCFDTEEVSWLWGCITAPVQEGLSRQETQQPTSRLVLMALKGIVACHVLGYENQFSAESVMYIRRKSNEKHNPLATEVIQRYGYKLWDAPNILYKLEHCTKQRKFSTTKEADIYHRNCVYLASTEFTRPCKVAKLVDFSTHCKSSHIVDPVSKEA